MTISAVPTSSSYVADSEVVVEASTSGLDYQRKMIVLIASVIGSVVMVILFARLFWGLCKNRQVIQKIYEHLANPRYWFDDVSRKGNGKCKAEALLAMEEGKSAEMPKEIQMKKDDLSDESEKMVEMKKVPEESFTTLMNESQSREEAKPK